MLPFIDSYMKKVNEILIIISPWVATQLYSYSWVHQDKKDPDRRSDDGPDNRRPSRLKITWVTFQIRSLPFRCLVQLLSGFLTKDWFSYVELEKLEGQDGICKLGDCPNQPLLTRTIDIRLLLVFSRHGVYHRLKFIRNHCFKFFFKNTMMPRT